MGSFQPAAGSGTAGDRVVECYADTIYRVAVHYLKVREEAEDIVHDVLLKWLEKAPSFHSEEHEKAWFLRVTVNACKDRRKSAYFARRVALDRCPELPADSPSTLLEEVLSLPLYSTLLYNGSWWVAGEPACLYDYRFDILGASLSYHSDCGTVYNKADGRSLELSEEQRVWVNELLDSLCWPSQSRTVTPSR